MKSEMLLEERHDDIHIACQRQAERHADGDADPTDENAPAS